jgi:hypothetical protein
MEQNQIEYLTEKLSSIESDLSASYDLEASSVFMHEVGFALNDIHELKEYLGTLNNNMKKTIQMGDMKPLQAGTIVSGNYKGTTVMRTKSEEHFEVMLMDTTTEYVFGCFSGVKRRIMVELLPAGTQLSITSK